jgi:hypothetical protein
MGAKAPLKKSMLLQLAQRPRDRMCYQPAAISGGFAIIQISESSIWRATKQAVTCLK